jgi:general secretion pathway protein J
MRRQAGVTLIEVLIAITLLSMIAAGMLYAMRIGLMAFEKTDTKLMDNRRVAGAQRLVEQELQGLMPVVAPCGGPGMKNAFFQGEQMTMRLVSTFSLQEAWRGMPQILELFVIPGDEGVGVRLVVNEIPYTGPVNAALLCPGMTQDPQTGAPVPRFLPVRPSPRSFVLADKLAYCRFVYLVPRVAPDAPEIWTPHWTNTGWPLAVRIEMAPIESDAGRLQPIAVVAPITIRRSLEIPYADN